MFGLGAGELIVIAIITLLVLGPDKLPTAAKTIGKGIRDLRRHSRDLQTTIERDTEIGDAVRELRSALRGDERPPIPPAARNRVFERDPVTAAPDGPVDGAAAPDVALEPSTDEALAALAGDQTATHDTPAPATDKTVEQGTADEASTPDPDRATQAHG